ncbi:metalloregulator ArsR/SmtB family transcription factor [Isoptericola variabilis]|uniref:Putative transcriptional regulator n=1 Tax=Isoptericola variabilis (strain 225) TaxID=743718 RepID=F6FT63_ISOV2|nr:helix-turn-helix domain-containing protein [Isoptericola variabilis]AEG44134.1 putative transcriptional regulator [Isoptericola variabilis 225]TWH28552.1 putative ArsR family transcriptional regulator [Isoptericola variabilis J7]
MSTTHAPAHPAPLAQHAPAHDADGTTRRRVLELVATEGPVTAGELAAELGLTSAAVRRHLALLEDDGKVTVHDAGPASGQARRGRPARRYVVSAGGQSELAGGYSELAAQTLRYLRDAVGPEAVAAFAAQRYAAVVRRYSPELTATDPQERAAQLAELLSDDGYAASVRPVVGPLVPTVQLCQGHCPVQHVAQEFTELCEAEARAFSELLGTHVQRLATIAGGAHACVTNVPLTQTTTQTQYPSPAGRTRGTQEGSR